MIISLLGLNGAGIQTSLWKKCQFRPKLVQYITLVYHPPVVRGSAAFTSKTSLSKPKQEETGIHKRENAAEYVKHVKQESLDNAYSVVLFRNFGCLSSVLDVFYVRGLVI